MFVIMVVLCAVIAVMLFIQFKSYGHHPRKMVSGDTLSAESCTTEMLIQL